jgi:hypothetical protein
VPFRTDSPMTATDAVPDARRIVDGQLGVHWEHLTAIAMSVLLAPGEIHKGRKVLSNLSILLVDDTAALARASVASFLASHRVPVLLRSKWASLRVCLFSLFSHFSV